MPWVEEFLLSNVTARLVLIAALGYLLGEIRFPGNFRLGTAATLFVGLAFGIWNPKFALPGELQSLGLVLFIYCIGVASGPGFFRCMRSDGWRSNAFAAVCLVGAAAIVFLCIQFTPLQREMLTGLFTGAFNNTPAMGAAVETALHQGTPPAVANQVVVGYGLVYPFSVIALLVAYQWMCRRQPGGAGSGAPMPAKLTPPDTLTVVSAPPGQDAWSASEVMDRTGLILSRVFFPDGRREVVTSHTRLTEGCRVIAIGSPEQLEAGAKLLGAFSTKTLETQHEGFEIHRYMVSQANLGGSCVREVQAELEKMGAVLTRLRRGDVELPVRPDVRIEMGDRVRVVSYPSSVPEVRKFLGDSLEGLSETSYLSIMLGILLGLLLGAVPIPVPGLAKPLQLGVAGGPLLVALAVGYFGRTGPIVWSVPITTNLAFRNLGLVLFFAVVGVRAGGGLVDVIDLNALVLVALGVAVMLIAHFAFWGMLWVRGERDLAVLLGLSAGMQTQPAMLAFAGKRAPAGVVAVNYAAVFPLAAILKIVLAQVLVLAG